MDACAAQSTVAGQHRLSGRDAELLRGSGVPILVAIAERDSLMSPSAQHKLAALLQAKTHISAGGHMGTSASFVQFADVVVDHFRAAQ